MMIQFSVCFITVFIDYCVDFFLLANATFYHDTCMYYVCWNIIFEIFLFVCSLPENKPAGFVSYDRIASQITVKYCQISCDSILL